MIKIKAITSGKGGVGKSTCSIELAFALEKLGQRVLLIDADQGMRCLDILLGVSEGLLFDLSDAVKGRDLYSCLLPIKKHPGISLLPAPAVQNLFSAEEFSLFLEGIDEELFDTVLIDLPAGIDQELFRALPLYTEFICVCNPNAVSVRDAAAVGKAVKEAKKTGTLIINRYQTYFIKNPIFSDLDTIIDQTGLTLIGIVPESEKLSLAFLYGDFSLKGREGKAFTRIGGRIIGKNIPLPKLKKI